MCGAVSLRGWKCHSSVLSCHSFTEFLILLLRLRVGLPSGWSLDLVSCLCLLFCSLINVVLKDLHLPFGVSAEFLGPLQSGGNCKINTISSASPSLTFTPFLHLVCSLELITFKKLGSYAVCVCCLETYISHKCKMKLHIYSFLN